MMSARLVDELVVSVFSWRPTPDRFIKSGRSWIPRTRFRPLTDIRDAFRLLESAKPVRWSLSFTPDVGICAKVEIEGRRGTAVSSSKSEALTLAVAKAVGIDVESSR